MGIGMVYQRTSSSTGKNKSTYMNDFHTAHFSDEQKLTMLHTAVHPIQEFHQVKATAMFLKVQHIAKQEKKFTHMVNQGS
jgi:fructose 1,6-bisphosphatase